MAVVASHSLPGTIRPPFLGDVENESVLTSYNLFILYWQFQDAAYTEQRQ